MAARAHASSNRADVRENPFVGYRDIVQLAAGERASVYSAREQSTGRAVALKVLSVHDVSPSAREAFAREAAVLGRLSTHPNIVTLYETFTLADGRPVLVLELCQGSFAEQLADGLYSRRLSVPEVVSIGIKIAGALETAHGSGVLHRNVRPENLLVTQFGEPALADFAVARLQSAGSGASVNSGHFFGMHIAPELLLGDEATPSVDVYGLAASLHTLLTGQSPIPIYAGESPAASILRVLRDEVRPVVSATIPLDLSDLLLWALAKEPASRPPSLSWFAEELARIEQHHGWPRTHPYVREGIDPVSEPSSRRHRSLPWRRAS